MAHRRSLIFDITHKKLSNFYQPFHLSNTALPNYMSADYRVGKMNGITLGIKYGMPMQNNTELSFRLEFFQQSSKSTGVEQPGTLKDFNLYPNIDAVIAQVSYSF